MTQPRTRRRLAAVTASALLGLTVAAAPMSPAAAEETARISGHFNLWAIAVGVGPDSAGKTVDLRVVNRSDAAVARNLTVRFDSASVTKLLVTPPKEGCTTAGTVTTCTYAELLPGSEVRFPFTFKVAPGAAVGDEQPVSFEVGGENAEPVDTPPATTVRIVDSGVDLVAGDLRFDDVKPGTTLELRPTVANAGDTAATGMALELGVASRYLTFVEEYDNCGIVEGFPICIFPDTLEPGAPYQLVDPLRVTVSKATPMKPSGIGFAYHVWSGDTRPYAAAAKALAGKRHGKSLRLQKAAGTQDVSPIDNQGYISVRTTLNPADLGVDGVKLAGKVNDELSFTVALANHGPADTASRADDDPGSLGINAPSGTVFTAVDRECFPIINGKGDPAKMGQPGYRTYHCLVIKGIVLAGESISFPFRLKITNASVGDDGWVAAEPGYVPDDNPKNNKAALVVKVEGGGGTPSGSPSASGGGGGGDAGDGGPLPTTGVSLPVYGAVAALLIGVGGVLYLVARRRRTADVAVSDD